jgi:hypothetical protein
MNRLIRKAVHWSLFILIIIYFITGLSITGYDIAEALTFGLLSRNLLFTIHLNLWIPFLVLLILHVLFSLRIIK